MATQRLKYDITKDDLSAFKDKGPAFVTFGEVMVRDTPNDAQRLESSYAAQTDSHVRPADYHQSGSAGTDESRCS